MDSVQAIEIALEAYKSPQAFRAAHRMPLPDGMLTLIKLAASTPDNIRNLVDDDTADQLPVRDAAIFYLQHVLTHAHDDASQLALTKHATLQEVKDHKRWLLKWLHPDRNPNSWESVLFHRVKEASTRLEASLRDGRQEQLVISFSKTRRHAPSQWHLAQRRVARPVGWRSRTLKLVLATLALVILVIAAQFALNIFQVKRAAQYQSTTMLWSNKVVQRSPVVQL